MDDTDFRLLQAMGFQPYLPGHPPADARKASRLAERVGLGPKAARVRLAALEASGVIAGYDAFPNLRHFPLDWKSFHFHVPDDRLAGFVDAARPMEGVVGHFRFLGGDVCIDLCYQDEPELRRRLQLLTTLAGAPPWEFYDNAVPEPARPMTPLDWRIIRELRHDALRSFADVASALRVTERTVRDRFDRMVNGRNLWIVPRIDYSRIPSFIPFGLLVRFLPAAHTSPGKAASEVRRLLADRTLYSWVPPAQEVGHLALFVRAGTTAEIEATKRKVAALSGVEAVTVLIPTGIEATQAWLDEAIARKAAEPVVSVLGAPAPANGRQ